MFLASNIRLVLFSLLFGQFCHLENERILYGLVEKNKKQNKKKTTTTTTTTKKHIIVLSSQIFDPQIMSFSKSQPWVYPYNSLKISQISAPIFL